MQMAREGSLSRATGVVHAEGITRDEEFDVVFAGAGARGFSPALNSPRPGSGVVILEKSGGVWAR